MHSSYDPKIGTRVRRWIMSREHKDSNEGCAVYNCKKKPIGGTYVYLYERKDNHYFLRVDENVKSVRFAILLCPRCNDTNNTRLFRIYESAYRHAAHV